MKCAAGLCELLGDGRRFFGSEKSAVRIRSAMFVERFQQRCQVQRALMESPSVLAGQNYITPALNININYDMMGLWGSSASSSS
jgi:hypothetical protein